MEIQVRHGARPCFKNIDSELYVTLANESNLLVNRSKLSVRRPVNLR